MTPRDDRIDYSSPFVKKRSNTSSGSTIRCSVDVYLGRQPILDRGWNIAGYELLFRSSRANFSDATDDVSATREVIVNAVLEVGPDRLLGGKPFSLSSIGRSFSGTGRLSYLRTRWSS